MDPSLSDLKASLVGGVGQEWEGVGGVENGLGLEGNFHLHTKSRGEGGRVYLGNNSLLGVYKGAGAS